MRQCFCVSEPGNETVLLLLHAEIRVTLSHKNVTGAPYTIIVNAANSPQWLMSVAKGVTE